MRAVALGAHILDVLVRPVTEIPPGQQSALVEQIRLAPAGAAGGTAVTLAKLGAQVTSAGAIGADDLGDILVRELERHGVDCAALARREDVQTSASVLPIRPNGDRPALHVLGANVTYTEADVPWEAIAAADVLHMGGPEFLGPELAGRILEYARGEGVRTSADVLADGNPGLLEYIAPALQHVDYLFPNDEQARGFTGEEDVVAAARALLELGVGCVAVTLGAEGSEIVTPDDVLRVAALEIEVVDTSGAGDAYAAGFMCGLARGDDAEGAARLGTACAALVAQGLGSDAGDFDLAAADALAGTLAAG